MKGTLAFNHFLPRPSTICVELFHVIRGEWLTYEPGHHTLQQHYFSLKILIQNRYLACHLVIFSSKRRKNREKDAQRGKNKNFNEGRFPRSSGLLKVKQSQLQKAEEKGEWKVCSPCYWWKLVLHDNWPTDPLMNAGGLDKNKQPPGRKEN